MAVVHEWRTRPIVTLISERHKWKATWHQGPRQYTFAGHIDNILKVQVRFRFKDPYAGMAKYKVLIDKKVSDGWQSVHYDEVFFNAPERRLYTEHKEYDLYQSAASFWLQKSLHFRVSVSIKKPSDLPTGSYDIEHVESWTPVESKEYVAIFRKPRRAEVAQYIERVEASYEEIVKTLKKKMPKR